VQGTGHFARALHERYQWPMFPLDLGWEGLQYARSMGIPNLAQADIQALPYKHEAFDCVVSMDVVVHLPRGNEAKPMREFHRVLAPGGLLVLRVSALDILRSHHSIHAMERQRFTRSRLLALAAECGFRTLRISYANSLLLPVALFKFRVIEPLLGGEPQSGVTPVSGWLDQLLHAPLALEAGLLASGVNLPLGQSLILLAEKR
jgi:SAM-dependent methyltransferase